MTVNHGKTLRAHSPVESQNTRGLSASNHARKCAGRMNNEKDCTGRIIFFRRHDIFFMRDTKQDGGQKNEW